MGFVDGHVLRDQTTAERRSTRPAGARAGESIVDVLARHPRRRRRRRRARRPRQARGLHRAPAQALVQRSSRRRTSSPSRPVPLVHEVHDRLAARIPEQQGVADRPRRLPPRQLHGRRRRRRRRRPRLGALHARRPARRRRAAAGVLDRPHATPRPPLLGVAPPLAAGFPTRAELIERYAAASRPRPDPPRLLRGVRVLEAGLHPRGRVHAATPAGRWATPAGFEGFANQVTRLAEQAAEAAERLRLMAHAASTSCSSEPDLESPGRSCSPSTAGSTPASAPRAARAALLESLDTVTVATFDADELLDHRARRPIMHLVDGVLTGLTWPSIELRAATDVDGNDLLLLVGAEPDHRWHAFCRAVVDLAMGFGARMVVGLGAYPAPVPHTRPTRLAPRRRPTERPRPVLRGAHHRRRARRRAGRHRAAGRRGRPARHRPVGPGAALRVGDAFARRPSAALIDGARHGRPTCRSPSDELHRQAAGAPRAGSTSSSRPTPSTSRWCASSRSNGTPRRPASVGPVDAGSGSGPVRCPRGDELAAELERFLREQGN